MTWEKLNKDFLDDLPGLAIDVLIKLFDKFGQEPWFEQAWEEYRQHILTSKMDEMKMPGFVFNKYRGV